MARTVLWYRVMVEYESDAPLDEDHDMGVVTDQLEGLLDDALTAGDLDPEHYTIKAKHVVVDRTAHEHIDGLIEKVD